MGKKSEVTVDFMKKEDLDQVLAIEQASFSMPWSRNLFLAELRNRAVSTSLVALAGNPAERVVTGYIVFWSVEDEMHILNLATAPAFRRQAVAKGLVRAGLRHAYGRGARRAFLEVRASNAPAQKLYLDLGFTGSFVRRGYYDEPVEDAVVMALAPGAYKALVEQKD